jgi:hypothetical protein
MVVVTRSTTKAEAAEETQAALVDAQPAITVRLTRFSENLLYVGQDMD